ncbi:MAG: 1-acyl-sn-glycerol-3-phosphate acyltransferase [Thermoanaerobaculia bacterium]
MASQRLARELVARDDRVWRLRGPGADPSWSQEPVGVGTASVWLPPGVTPQTDVVYLAAGRGHRGRPDLADARRELEPWTSATEARVVVVASAAVHEPTSHSPGMISEAEWAAPREGNEVATAWARLEEELGALFANADASLAILRVPTVAVPGGNDPVSRLLTGALAFPSAGFDPPLQLLDVADLAAAIEAVLSRGAVGVLQAAPRRVLSLRQAIRAAGGRRVAVPFAARLLGGFDPDERQYLRHPWTVSGRRLAEVTGFEPRFTSAETLERQFGREPSPWPEPDPYGQDRRYIDRLGATWFRFLHDVYWRVEVRGLEHVPRRGGAVLVGTHRGFQPWDGVMVLQLLARELGRYPRFLLHPTLVKFPVLTPYMMKLGGMVASRANADWVLERDELLGVYPEGVRGAFALYRDAYRIDRLGRAEWVRMALAHGAPIVPFVTVGSAESFPILGRIDCDAWKRYSLWPFIPLTTPLPLPSKWHTEFLEPLPMAGRYPPEAADDPEVVTAIHDEVRDRMRRSMEGMVRRRRAIFFGGAFERGER